MNIEYSHISRELNSMEHDPAAKLSLLPLRILSVANEPGRENTKNIRNDFNELVKVVKQVVRSHAGIDYFSSAAKLISLIEPTMCELALRQLDFTIRMRIKNKALDDVILFIVDTAIQWYAQNNYIGTCGDLIANLIRVSEQESNDSIMRHRSLITAALSILVDLDREKTITICESQEKYFMRSSGIHAAQFYWYYAFSLYVTGNAEQAKPKLLKCNELYTDVEGKQSWIGTLALVFYHYIGLESSEDFISEQYLWNFLKLADTGFFDVDNPQGDEIRIHTRYVLLRRHMEKQTLRSLFPEISRYRKECEKHQYKTSNPRLTVRTAENLLCAYYFEIGDYLNAAHHAMLSLETESPNHLPAVPTDDLLYATLLQLYNAMNDGQQMAKYVECLARGLVTAEIDEEYYRKRLLVHTAQIKLGVPMDPIILEYRRDILKQCQLLQKGNTTDLDKWGISIAYWHVAMISVVNNLVRLDNSELQHCEQLLKYFLNNPSIFPFNNIQLTFTYLELARIQWAQHSEVAVHTMQRSLQYCRKSVISNDVKVTILRAAAELFFDYNRLSEAASELVSATENIMNGITHAWQAATKYLNDHRLSQILASAQSNFDGCYALLSEQTTAEMRYTYLLRFKNLAALAGRERNHILQNVTVDESLKADIHNLQNRLAVAELDDAQQGSEKAAIIQKQLLHLEAVFSQKFPEALQFGEIDYNKVAGALPIGEAIVEYYFSQRPQKNNPSEMPALNLEIFVVVNTSGRSQLHHVTIPHGDQLLMQANDFISILQKPDDATGRGGDKTTLRAKLYRQLLEPVMPFLKGVKTLYIAPDRELFNLPFEILYADRSGLLQDWLQVCRIISGRDILYFNRQASFNDGCFLLGDPAYGPEDNSPLAAEQRKKGKATTVRELPFSGMEVARISKYFHSSCCTRFNATKYALAKAGACRVIHLATHGSFDKTMDSDALYSSCLIFAGYNNWVTNKGTLSGCGNGVLTADEISRLDLRGTELVVLSACLSGMGDISYGTMQGLISAFSAAGVRWIVSHVWEANDFTTPILMDAFYDSYLNKGFSVPDALQYAKSYLSTATVGQLRQNEWFTPPDDVRISEHDKAYLDMCNRSIDRRKLFQDELYWGGFVVYRCR